MARIRIGGGEWRSRLIKVTDHIEGLRPTPDRVRMTLFNWLGQDLTGLRCLDLFAGTGILGFEAASRGAQWVTLVEQNPRVFATLRESANSLGNERLELLRADALKFAAGATKPYDLVFLDPPYHQGWLERIEPLLARLTHPDTRLYVEAEHPVPTLGHWHCIRQGQAGQVFYQLLAQE